MVAKYRTFFRTVLKLFDEIQKTMFNPMAEVNQLVGVQLSSVKAFMISII